MPAKTSIKGTRFERDGHFYKPGLDVRYEVNAVNLAGTNQDWEGLAFTSYGKKLVYGIADDAMRGKFEAEGIKESILHQVQEDLWPALTKCLYEQRKHGLGFLIATRKGEKAVDLQRPWRPIAPGERIAWKSPLTLKLTSYSNLLSPPILDVLDWSENWLWYSHNIHKSRMLTVQFIEDEEHPMGHGEVEFCTIPLYLLYNLERGGLDRIGVWSFLRYLYKIDSAKLGLTDAATLERLAEKINQSQFIPVESSDDIVNLSDKAGHGLELQQIGVNALSAATGVPSLVWIGSAHGSVTGGEMDMTQYGQVLSNIQSKLSLTIKDVFQRFYSLDVDECIWNMDFYQSERTRLENEYLRLRNETATRASKLAGQNRAFSMNISAGGENPPQANEQQPPPEAVAGV